MLRFFRQIRKTLVEQNKVRSYLIYAFGEIFLVVIGILIALQVNNWNEERKLQKEEHRYITELISDLQQDSLALWTLQEEARIIGRSKIILVQYFDDPTQVPDSLGFHHYNQWFSIKRFTPLTTTMDEIKSGIGLGVIRDDKLRRALVGLYNDFEQWQVDDNIFQKSLDDFFDLSRKHLKNVNNPTEGDLIALYKIPEVSNIIRTNYANSRSEAITQLLDRSQEVLGQLRNYRMEITE